MEPYVFDDVLTGSTVTCAYPGLDASAAKGASAPAACPSLFFPGCSFVNYGLPLVKATYDLLKDAGRVDGMSLLCCGKILGFEPMGRPCVRRSSGSCVPTWRTRA